MTPVSIAVRSTDLGKTVNDCPSINMSPCDDIKKRVKQREDMFLRRLFGMLAKMAKADGKVDAWDAIRKARGM